MYRQITMRQLVAIVMIAGLALAPLSRPVMAESPPTGAMAAMSHDMAATADEMANDMPCCPSKAPSSSGCEKCLLMAACMATGFTVVQISTLAQFPAISSRTAQPKDDSWLQSLAHTPPDHPPRILI
ncbi:MAG: hypothetical protein ACRCTX_18785 [Afipia sp.]